MTELPALRQVVLMTADLTTALAEARSFLGLNPGVRDEAGMAEIGFEHEVLAVDNTFVEIVSPLSAETSAGRLLARRGDNGFMVVCQVADSAALIERSKQLGIAPVLTSVYEGNPLTQWHPRDLGTLAEIDEMRSDEWHLEAALRPTASTDVVRDIVAVEVAVPDPAGCAARWAALLGLDVEPGACRLSLAGRQLRFVPAEPGREGLVAVELQASDPARAAASATLCGVLFRTVQAPADKGYA